MKWGGEWCGCSGWQISTGSKGSEKVYNLNKKLIFLAQEIQNY